MDSVSYDAALTFNRDGKEKKLVNVYASLEDRTPCLYF